MFLESLVDRKCGDFALHACLLKSGTLSDVLEQLFANFQKLSSQERQDVFRTLVDKYSRKTAQLESESLARENQGSHPRSKTGKDSSDGSECSSGARSSGAISVKPEVRKGVQDCCGAREVFRGGSLDNPRLGERSLRASAQEISNGAQEVAGRPDRAPRMASNNDSASQPGDGGKYGGRQVRRRAGVAGGNTTGGRAFRGGNAETDLQ